MKSSSVQSTTDNGHTWLTTHIITINIRIIICIIIIIMHLAEVSRHCDCPAEKSVLCQLQGLSHCDTCVTTDPGRVSHFFCLRESIFYDSGVLAKVRREMREFYAGYRLSSVTILWAELTKCSKEIFCSRNLVSPRDFYDARRTFYASSYEILVEKKCETRPCTYNSLYLVPNFHRVVQTEIAKRRRAVL